MLHIDKDCYGTIAIAWLVTLAVTALLLWLLGLRRDHWILFSFFAAIALVFMGFVTWFHRVPSRECPAGPADVVSVADGKVVIVEKAYEKEYLKRDCIQVSIYMNFFDVHANFWPVSGEVTYYKYHPGKNHLAFKDKSSDLNEHSSTAIKTPYGEVFFKQIAGTFARRIVCYSNPGLKTRAGKQCGIIKFGSRIDIYLPLDADIKVKVGDLTRACETIVATLKN